MIAELKDDIKHVVVLDISGIYAQIYNQGYFDKENIEWIQQQYSDRKHWKVLILDWYIEIKSRFLVCSFVILSNICSDRKQSIVGI